MIKKANFKHLFKRYHAILKLEYNFKATALASLLHFQFWSDKKQYSNSTSKILTMYDQIIKHIWLEDAGINSMNCTTHFNPKKILNKRKKIIAKSHQF